MICHIGKHMNTEQLAVFVIPQQIMKKMTRSSANNRHTISKVSTGIP